VIKPIEKINPTIIDQNYCFKTISCNNSPNYFPGILKNLIINKYEDIENVQNHILENPQLRLVEIRVIDILINQEPKAKNNVIFMEKLVNLMK
jgi:hypothetical protein